MLLKRTLFKKKQLLLKINFLKTELKALLIKSLLRNHYNHYIFRLSFCMVNKYDNKKHYTKSYQKLLCPYLLCKKVPSNRFMYSRFFLNKKMNLNKINGVFK